MAEQKKPTVEELPEYLLEHPDEGNNLSQAALSTNYLQILQDLSDAVKNKVPGAEPGLWYVSGSQQVLGTEIEVIVAACEEVWDERDAVGKTIDRYRPYEVEYTEQPNPKNPRFPKKVSKAGNEIVATCAYALIIKDHPEFGFVLHTAGIGSMASYRRWNTARDQTFMPNGRKAACYAKSWKLRTGSKISKSTGKPFYGLDSADVGTWTQESVYHNSVEPARLASQQPLMIADQTIAEVAEE